jgi:proton-dependent oligopeptide transporter, POT family
MPKPVSPKYRTTNWSEYVAMIGRHPTNLYRLSFIEVWERTGYYITMAVLVLFLAAPVRAAGLGWTNSDALIMISIFGGCVFATAVVGGWVADRWLGEIRAILTGATMMAVGYGLIWAIIPIGRWLGVDAQDGAPIANPFIYASSAAEQAHAWVLVAALGLISIGNGLLKPCIAALVNAQYAPDDPRQEAGYTLFWTCINAGAFLALALSGFLAPLRGWASCFLAAAICLTIAIFSTLLSASKLAATIPASRSQPVEGQISLGIAPAMALIGMGLAVALFNAGFNQTFGLLNLAVEQNVDRNVLGWIIPTPWVQSINPLTILFFAPVTTVLWLRLQGHRRNPSPPMKFAIAFMLMSISLMLFSSFGSDQGLLLVLSGIFIISIAEICLQPIGLSFASRLAPQRYANLVMGGWYMAYAAGNFLAHQIGRLADIMGTSGVFVSLAGGAIICSFALVIAAPTINNIASHN